MKVKMYVKILIMCVVATFFTCNLFSPQEIDEDKWYMVGEAWVIEGKKKMQDKKWEEALECFDKALVKNGSLSEAYFYRGKCILRIHNVDLSQVWDEINPPEGSQNVPFLFNPVKDSIFWNDSTQEWDTVVVQINVLDSLDTQFSVDLYDWNEGKYVAYTAYILIDSVFLERKRIYDAMYQSINMLDTIYYYPLKMDGVIKREQYESDYLVEISVLTILGIVDVDNDGILDWDTDERKVFRIISQDIPSLDSMEFDSLKQISKNPNDIKENLDLILLSLDLADSSYNKFLDELAENDMDTMGGELGEMISNLKKILPYFYYDDYKDNDKDYFNTNGNDTTITIGGTKYVKHDRMIWIDWDDDTLIDIYSPTDTAHRHIGDSIHRIQHPEFYKEVDSDDSYDRYVYTGPYTYEFIGGDWGVDEEILDGHDNDFDGLVDEDTRNVADTLDDDGDWYNTDPITLINDTNFNPMVWTDIDGDSTIDIGISGWIKKVISAQFKGLHSIDYEVLYDKSLPDSVPVYRGTYANEFSGGDYGVDEEWYDGVDNDNDGLIDEDVNEDSPPEFLRDEIIAKLRAAGLRGNQ